MLLRIALATILAFQYGSVVDSLRADERRDQPAILDLFRPLGEQVKESVVQILCGGTPVALGTVVAADGYVMTKRSELTSDPIRVRFADGRLFPARVAAVKRRNDLALLRVDAEIDFQPLTFATRSPAIASFLISVGRTGRPIGLGVVGVKERPIEHRGRLGVMLEDDAKGRALVQLVLPESGAAIAGISPGDRIIAINGEAEGSRDAVINRLKSMYPGESVKLTILRPNDLSEFDSLDISAQIRELGMLQESASDTKVNGPRNIRLSGFDRVIQHDTVLDPEDCGGPVIDSEGRAIGMNIARAGRVVSYLLPSSLILPEMLEMLEEARANLD
ncbi:MAG: trypsin-like peptidase domain-containing protein [Rubripirellula sp.]